MGGNLLGWPTLLIILVVILLLFGAAKLPALAKSVGQSARVFKGEMKAMKEDDAAAAQNSSAAVPESSSYQAPSPASDPESPDRPS